MKNKILALLLMVVFVFGLLPYGAVYSAQDSANSSAVGLLNALGIMGIDENTGNFWDDSYVERREMAKILCKLFKLEPTAEEVPMFTDVPEDDRGYVETVVRNGYMSGYGNKTFGSKDYVTGAQMLKIFVNIMGAGQLAENMGGFPDGYIEAARHIGLNKSAGYGTNNPAKRIDVANLINSALNSDIVRLSGTIGDNATFTTVKGHTFLTERLKIYRTRGILCANEVTSTGSTAAVSKGCIKVGDTIIEDKEGLSAEYLGSYVTVYEYREKEDERGELIYIEADKKNKVLLINADDYVNTSGFYIEFYDGNKIVKEELSSSLNMIYNGKYIKYDSKRFDVESGYIKLIDNDFDGVFDVASVVSYENLVVDRVSLKDKRIITKFNGKIIDLSDAYTLIYCDGIKVGLEAVKAGNVLSVAVSDGEGTKAIRLDASSVKFIGTVSGIANDGEYTFLTIGDKKYKMSRYCEGLAGKNSITSLEIGISGQFYIDIYGNIVYYTANAGGTKAGYLIVSNVNDNSLLPTIAVQIYTTDNKIEKFTATKRLEINGVKTDISDAISSISLMNQFRNPQLVEYEAEGNALKKINFAAPSYDKDSFSMDVTGRLQCTTKFVINHKYSVPAETVVFYVPTVSKTDANFYELMTDIKNYQLKDGSYFSGGSWYDDLSLYDINVFGQTKYAVVKINPRSSGIWEYQPLVAVLSVANAIDDSGNETKILKGYDEGGSEVELVTVDNSVIMDLNFQRSVKPGDVIQYRTNNENKVAELEIRHGVDEQSYYAPMAIDSVYADPSVYKTYGYVLNCAGTSMMLGDEKITAEPEFSDIRHYVNDTGGQVFIFDRKREKIIKASFSDIERGNDVFVCINRSNSTRMIVIYK